MCNLSCDALWSPRSIGLHREMALVLLMPTGKSVDMNFFFFSVCTIRTICRGIVGLSVDLEGLSSCDLVNFRSTLS